MDSLINSSRTVINKTVESKHFLPFFDNKEIINIKSADIKSYQLQRKLEIMNLTKNAGKREQDITFKSINNELGTLSNFFNFCVEKGYADKNPALPGFYGSEKEPSYFVSMEPTNSYFLSSLKAQLFCSSFSKRFFAANPPP